RGPPARARRRGRRRAPPSPAPRRDPGRRGSSRAASFRRRAPPPAPCCPPAGIGAALRRSARAAIPTAPGSPMPAGWDRRPGDRKTGRLPARAAAPRAARRRARAGAAPRRRPEATHMHRARAGSGSACSLAPLAPPRPACYFAAAIDPSPLGFATTADRVGGFPVIVGVPKEIKVHEYRVGMVPAFVRALTSRGHEVLVEKGAGAGSFISDEEYVAAGARIVPTAEDVWKNAELIVKVKEPIEPEYERIQPRQTIYTFFHLAAVPDLAQVLVEKKVTAIAYETIQLPNGSLPLLRPMSEVAGRLAVQAGAACLTRE